MFLPSREMGASTVLRSQQAGDGGDARTSLGVRRSRLVRPLAFAAVAAVVIVAVLVAAAVARSGARDREGRSMASAAATTARTVGDMLSGLAGAAGIVSPDGTVPLSAFQAFADGVTASTPLSAVALVDVVPAAERAAYEQRLGRPIVDGANAASPSPERDTYYVVRAVSPASDNGRQLVGVDLGAEATRGEAIRTALAQAAPALSTPLRSQPAGDPAFFIAKPLYRPTAAGGGQAPVALVTSAYLASQLVQTVAANLPARSLRHRGRGPGPGSERPAAELRAPAARRRRQPGVGTLRAGRGGYQLPGSVGGGARGRRAARAARCRVRPRRAVRPAAPGHRRGVDRARRSEPRAVLAGDLRGVGVGLREQLPGLAGVAESSLWEVGEQGTLAPVEPTDPQVSARADLRWPDARPVDPAHHHAPRRAAGARRRRSHVGQASCTRGWPRRPRRAALAAWRSCHSRSAAASRPSSSWAGHSRSASGRTSAPPWPT